MDLNPSDEQLQLVETFAAFYAKECPVERVRAAEPQGYDPELWSKLRVMGCLDMAVDETAGGWGGSLLDLALVAEQHGRHLAPAPLIEAQVAARLLARFKSSAAGEVLERALHGDRLTTLSLHPPVDGVLSLVPAGAIADEVVFLDGDMLGCATLGGRARAVANQASMPVADVAVDAAAVEELASGERARSDFEEARDEWLALTANALVGIGARALEIGVAYVEERHAFGVPIGSFQAVSHGLADAATAMDGGALLAREAAWAADEDPGRAGELASLACGFCTDATRRACERSLHYHGGYGFMLESDIQLFFRRARSWPALFGDPSSMYARGEALRLSGRRTGV